MESFIKKKFGASLTKSVVRALTQREEEFGEELVSIVREFCASDLKTVTELEADEFSHVTNPSLKSTLARTYYGARWLYKLSLATLSLTDGDVEKSAHIRVQVIDYGAIAEAVLVDLVAHGVAKGHFKGTKHKMSRSGKGIAWSGSADKYLKTSKKQPFEWHIDVAREEGAVDGRLTARLHELRKRRNKVHITEGVLSGVAYSSRLATSAHNVLIGTLRQTKAWKLANP